MEGVKKQVISLSFKHCVQNFYLFSLSLSLSLSLFILLHAYVCLFLHLSLSLCSLFCATPTQAEEAAGEQYGGKLVVYTSSVKAIKATANDCLRVRRLLQSLRVRFEERDVFMSSRFSTEMQSRCPGMRVPQVFFNGKLLGVRRDRK